MLHSENAHLCLRQCSLDIYTEQIIRGGCMRESFNITQKLGLKTLNIAKNEKFKEKLKIFAHISDFVKKKKKISQKIQ